MAAGDSRELLVIRWVKGLIGSLIEHQATVLC